ncbi:hypothetical protein TNIN_23391 [Trichonephila inaurata madagascariensis]|uniref:Uncharacterized protein n=1 Tax=Trichonephila inaurata madagascariensis TaxID=2747483 RepID=A0A8X6YJH5_9ARAC|nr:hypothetical protein TNIN_23391 [Trichonephila inaurata madagascariensis]
MILESQVTEWDRKSGDWMTRSNSLNGIIVQYSTCYFLRTSTISVTVALLIPDLKIACSNPVQITNIARGMDKGLHPTVDNLILNTTPYDSLLV